MPTPEVAKWSFAAGAATDKGHVRSRNEDAYYASERLVAVADGLGGHYDGEVASHLAVSEVAAYADRSGGRATPEGLAAMFDRANEIIFEDGMRRGSNMATTLCVLAVAADGRLIVANVGDSRVYRCSPSTLRQLTVDHRTFENSLSRVVGFEPRCVVDVATLSRPRLGQRYLLCSDGLTLEVSGRAIRERLTAAGGPQAAADALVAAALRTRARDNIAVVVADPQRGSASAASGAASG